MKTLFVKGGDYSPSISYDTAGAVNELLGAKCDQLIRSNAIFVLYKEKNEFVFIEGADVRGRTSVNSKFQFLDMLEHVEKYKFIFYGIVPGDQESVTTNSILSRAEPFYFRSEDSSFYSLKTNTKLIGSKMVSLFYLFKMNNSSAYACILNSFVTIDAFTINGENDGDMTFPNGRIIFSDTGNSIRSKLMDVKFSDNVTEMKYGHFLPTQVLCVRKGEPFSFTVFNKKFATLDPEFANGFKLEIKSPLPCRVDGNEISFSAIEKEQTSFFSMSIKGTEAYDYITGGNSFENLSLNFLVLVY